MNNPVSNFTNFVQQFNAFKNQMTQQGIDPRARVQQLLNSGQMTQEQFNQLRDIANQITGRNNNNMV